MASPLREKVCLISKEAIQIFPLEYGVKRKACAPFGPHLAKRRDTHHECLTVLLASPTLGALVLPGLMLLLDFKFLHGVEHLSFGDCLDDLVRFLHF